MRLDSVKIGCDWLERLLEVTGETGLEGDIALGAEPSHLRLGLGSRGQLLPG